MYRMGRPACERLRRERRSELIENPPFFWYDTGKKGGFFMDLCNITEIKALLNRHGVADIIELNLTPGEQARFSASCRTMDENYQLSLTL